MKIQLECEPATMITPSATGDRGEQEVTGCWAAPSCDRAARQELLELVEGDVGAQKEIEPTIAAKTEKTGDVEAACRGSRPEAAELALGDSGTPRHRRRR